MNKQKFNEAVKDHSNITDKELVKLVELEDDYPYSQIIHTLIAKISLDRKFPNAQNKLNKAAFYSTDRKVLKDFVQGKLIREEVHTPVEDRQPVPEVKPDESAQIESDSPSPVEVKETPKEDFTQEPKPIEESKELSYDIKPADTSEKITVSGDQGRKHISDTVLETLAELRQSRTAHDMEESRGKAGEENVKDKKPGKSEKPKSARKSTMAQRKTKKSTGKKASTKKSSGTKSKAKKSTSTSTSSRKKSTTTGKTKAKSTTKRKPSTRRKTAAKSQSSKSKAKRSTKSSGTKAKSSKSRSKTKSGTKSGSKKKDKLTPEPSSEQILTDIMHTHRKPQKQNKRSDLKRKAQMNIINEFIKKETELGKVNIDPDEPETKGDLSEHSSEFHDDLISENLARIFVKQKKYDQAIDIYKKLIWKFPQKKSYFASQIEEIKRL